MPSVSKEELIKNLYRKYSEELKPWLAAVEAKYHKFPAPLLNELRAFIDHVSRCYLNDASDASIEKNIDRASGHLERSIFDCIKHLVLWYHDEYTDFASRTKNIDLSVIDNGAFYVKVRTLSSRAEGFVRNAKILEKKEHDESYKIFQDAFNAYFELSELINTNLPNIDWARKRGNLKKTARFVLWVLSVVVSSVISFYVGQYLTKQSLSAPSPSDSPPKSSANDQLNSTPGHPQGVPVRK